jgi:putative Ca2+/H+ antiporter (TMEM165/GDT1 family)
MIAFLTVFAVVFLAELGDKTQIATFLFAAEGERPKALVFAAASLALVLSSAIAVLLGAAAERHLSAIPLKLIAGAGFIMIGASMVIGHFRA